MNTSYRALAWLVLALSLGFGAGPLLASEPAERNRIMGTGEPREPQPFTREQRLLDAVRRGDRRVVERALELGVPVESADDLERSALLLAVRDAQDADLVRYLHEQGGQIDRPDARGRSASSYAAGSGQLELLAYLAENGAQIDRPDKRGRTPLFHAVMTGQLDTVRWLLERGASIDAQDRYGDTPLIFACSKGHDAIAQLLVERGADASIENRQGRSAADRAAPDTPACEPRVTS